MRTREQKCSAQTAETVNLMIEIMSSKTTVFLPGPPSAQLRPYNYMGGDSGHPDGVGLHREWTCDAESSE